MGYKGQHLIGQAGVFRVASELMFRGVHILTPAVDMGADLYTEGGIRIQVKTSRYITPTGKSSFRLTRGYRVDSIGATSTLPASDYSRACDFIILYNAVSSQFWIVPSPLLDGMKACSAGHGTQTIFKPEERDIIMGLKDDGWSWDRLAEKYRVSPGALRQIVRNPSYGQHQSGRSIKVVVGIINEYEDRWDVIELEYQKRTAGVLAGEVCHSI